MCTVNINIKSIIVVFPSLRPNSPLQMDSESTQTETENINKYWEKVLKEVTDRFESSSQRFSGLDQAQRGNQFTDMQEPDHANLLIPAAKSILKLTGRQ